jgi:ABC-2 type transport system ATP-binding protein
VISAKGLCRSFCGLVVVEAVDLDVFPGEVLGLIGPNGGGKSTLLLLMAGLVRPTAGQVLVDGVPAHRLSLDHTGTVGLITAEPGLYPLLSGRENLRFFGGLFGLSREEIDEKSASILAELEVGVALDRSAAEYSSGMRQKVSLARALLLRPKVLLLDEPTSNLDPLSTHVIHQAVRTQADRGIAVVLCTHNLHAAEHICDRVAMLHRTLRATMVVPEEKRLPEPGRLFKLYSTHVEDN